MKLIFAVALLACATFKAGGQTIATFTTSVGTWEVELFDDKPVTVSNFIKYGTSGRYDDQIIHRWVPGFVLQGGGYTKQPAGAGDCSIDSIPTFGTIPNESQAGTFRSNVYGTIAMARQGTNVNSATSQWYINLADNGGTPPDGLDYYAEGYTVFGRVISGMDIINLFVPPPSANGIFIHQSAVGPMAVLTNSANLTCDDVITIDLSFRRPMNLEISRFRGLRQIAWDSVAGVTNVVESSANLTTWVNYTNVPGTGARLHLPVTSTDSQRYYRVQFQY